MMREQKALALAVAIGGMMACRGVGEYVWVDAYKEAPAAAASSGYVIAPGDSISVRVWNQESMSGRVRVRQDGKVSLPFVNDIQAAGLAPAALAERLQDRLKEFVVKPIITVSLEEPAPLEVSVVGEVTHAGVYRMDQDSSVLKALATAGGITQFASRDRIFVLRRSAATGNTAVPVRIRFTYEALERAEAMAMRFRLRAGDVVVVE
jgi:polysaccharide export outer membrane protein